MTTARAMTLASLIVLLGGCVKRNVIELDVRAQTSGRGRSFDWDPAQQLLTAWSSTGRLLQIWVRVGELSLGGETRREIPPGCRAGFLTRADTHTGAGPNSSNESAS